MDLTFMTFLVKKQYFLKKKKMSKVEQSEGSFKTPEIILVDASTAQFKAKEQDAG